MSDTQTTPSIPTATICELLELLAQQLRGRAEEKEGDNKIVTLLFPPADDLTALNEGIVEGLRLAEKQVLRLRDTVQVSHISEAEVVA